MNTLWIVPLTKIRREELCQNIATASPSLPHQLSAQSAFENQQDALSLSPERPSEAGDFQEEIQPFYLTNKLKRGTAAADNK